MASATQAAEPTTEERLRVVVVDDHDVVHWGLRVMLGVQPWVEGCVSARTQQEALAVARRYEPHVALIDLCLGEESGAELCEALQAASPGTRVLLISGVGRMSPAAASAAGAAGFLSKDADGRELAAAVRQVGFGRTVFQARHDQQPATPLSEREREVLAAVASGATNREIADRLHLSPHTVKEYTSAVYRKLEVRNRPEAVQRAERLGLLA